MAVLERDDVESRSWWPNVALGDVDGPTGFEAHEEAARAACWFWVGPDGARVYSRISRGEPVRNALFWHLRGAEWDVKDATARMRSNGVCRESACINPWHWEYRARVDAGQREEMGAVAVEELMADKRALFTALKVYWSILEPESYAHDRYAALVSTTGHLLRGTTAWADVIVGNGFDQPKVVAILEELLRRVRDGDAEAVSLPAANAWLEELAAEREEERAAQSAAFQQRLAALRGDAPGRKAVKRRPRRTG